MNYEKWNNLMHSRNSILVNFRDSDRVLYTSNDESIPSRLLLRYCKRVQVEMEKFHDCSLFTTRQAVETGTKACHILLIHDSAKFLEDCELFYRCHFLSKFSSNAL